MLTDDWHLTEDLEDFLSHAGEFLRSRPVMHTTPLTTVEKLRTLGPASFGDGPPVLGRLERAGEVLAAFHRFPSGGLSVTPLTLEQADSLAAHLVALGHALPSVSAEHATATAFAEAWQRHTGAEPSVRVRLLLRRLATLTPPDPFPAGRERALGEADHEDVMRWCRGFAAAVGESVTIDAGTWPVTRFAEKRYTFWETPDGTPVSIAGINPTVAGTARVDPVYTPAELRGRGYAAAVTVAVTRAALDAGATEAVLYTNAANATSNALYERIGYRPFADWTVYGLAPAAPAAG
ncbi:GNAT family N-acetyltransferase [Streptomyces amakusaensis]|uniref:GNAT family N-acetyltransferase n=1 Tax=Streptomyces amakusaensis TaxID=67271 RepID=A0ABW0AVL8_9ACTN